MGRGVAVILMMLSLLKISLVGGGGGSKVGGCMLFLIGLVKIDNWKYMWFS